MKSRWTTYLLIAAVVAVWGVVAWKIFTPATDHATNKAVQPAAPTATSPPRDTLQLDYPDPFLKNSTVRPLQSAKPVVRPISETKPVPAKREKVKITHMGTVTAGRRQFHILTIGEEMFEISLGEKAGDFTLASCDRDSLYMRKEGLIYGVKRCE